MHRVASNPLLRGLNGEFAPPCAIFTPGECDTANQWPTSINASPWSSHSPAQPARELDVFDHKGLALRMKRTQIPGLRSVNTIPNHSDALRAAVAAGQRAHPCSNMCTKYASAAAWRAWSAVACQRNAGTSAGAMLRAISRTCHRPIESVSVRTSAWGLLREGRTTWTKGDIGMSVVRRYFRMPLRASALGLYRFPVDRGQSVTLVIPGCKAEISLTAPRTLRSLRNYVFRRVFLFLFLFIFTGPLRPCELTPVTVSHFFVDRRDFLTTLRAYGLGAGRKCACSVQAGAPFLQGRAVDCTHLDRLMRASIPRRLAACSFARRLDAQPLHADAWPLRINGSCAFVGVVPVGGHNE